MTKEALFAACSQAFPETVRRLSELVAIPSCSFPGFDPVHLEASAQATATWFRAIGLPEVELLRVDGIPPYVIARDHRAGSSKPTLLLYAHHDVQPPMREELWTSPAYAPMVRDGRLFGRGAADDKAGIALHAASIEAWYKSAGSLPVNVTILIEGEEEVGSDHLETFIQGHKERLAADAVVIADLANYDTGVPSLTVSLRGLVAVELELKALERPVHSGVWGGTVPDIISCFCRILSSLTRPDGSIAIPGVLEQVVPATERELADWATLPFDRAHFARQAGIPTAFAPIDAVNLGRRLWRTPALTVNGIQSGTQGRTGNVLMDKAWARVGIRIVPGMDPRRTMDLLVKHLKAQVPSGMELSISEESLAPSWGTSTEHSLFAQARQAMREGYGKDPVAIGCGASIPFVEAVTAALGGVPALLVGVEDPWCNAHSENESVHLGDLEKAIKSQARLFGLAGGEAQ
jgi:cysteinylglycine-S-conjugate dipeptidase